MVTTYLLCISSENISVMLHRYRVHLDACCTNLWLYPLEITDLQESHDRHADGHCGG